MDNHNRKVIKLDTGQCPSGLLTNSAVVSDDDGSKEKKERNLLLQIDRYDNRLDQESLICQNIFPAEIWDVHIIKAHLADDANNLETLINSSPYFRELLKEQRVLFLAKKVLPHLFKWICLGGKPRLFRSDLEYSSQKYALKWRQICKSWCSSFDQLVEEKAIDCKYISRCPYRLHTDHHITQFQQHFEQTHPGGPTDRRNPFIGRFLSAYFIFESRHYSNQIVAFLRTYGHHLLHLKFDFRQCLDLSHEHFYLNFREMLMLLPNLQSLSVNYDDHGPFSEAFIREHPLPKLASLESLIIGKLPAYMFSELLRQNNHIASLTVESFEEVGDFNLELNNLRNLEIKVMTQDLPILPPVVTTWPITKLHLNYYRSEERWEAIFEGISNDWGNSNTLEDLTVLLPTPALVPGDMDGDLLLLNDTLTCRLNLPRLRVLQLMIEQYAFSIDFLLGMKLLERVKIWSLSSKIRYWESNLPNAYNLMDIAKNQIIKWAGYEQRLYESDLWNVFERLKLFELDGKKYRRGQWIKRSTIVGEKIVSK